MANNDILDIVRGISSAAALGYDGALDSDGQPIKIGLKREEGDPILDKRVIAELIVTGKHPLQYLKYHYSP